MHLKFAGLSVQTIYLLCWIRPMSLWDKNLYVYCDNDPVNKKDDDGEIADFVAMGIIGAVANVGISFITAKMLGQDYGWQNVLEDSISGALCAIPAISND